MDDWRYSPQVPYSTPPKLLCIVTKLKLGVPVAGLETDVKHLKRRVIGCCHFISVRLSTRLFGFCLSCAESWVTKKRRAACLWSERGLFNLWPSCTGKNERLQFPLPHGYHDITEVPLSKILFTPSCLHAC